VPWGRADAGAVLAAQARDFAARVGSGPWQVAWCAGAGVTSSAAAVLAEEERVFAQFLEALCGSSLSKEYGGVFLASSAGGVYAGSAGPPFDESSAPQPLSEYGRSKLRLEELLRRVSREYGLPTVVGRLGNLYGPGQNLGKAQGLVSHLCRCVLTRVPVALFVSLDTVRDYLYADDSGSMVVALLDRLRAATAEQGPSAHLKVLGSGNGVTVGFLLAEVERIMKRRPEVVFGATDETAVQARDLRLRSVVWPELDRRPLTPLPVGIAQVIEATRLRMLGGTLR
jgi:UDP-glucose 4-epimerase